ncbi:MULTISPECIES: aminotransferase class V-fold PLP-dependent enzyme [unclassified Clostridium]|uniref:O-acetylhomoserine aminocarboxypropyltransferase/cysteine synthase family protein n=1 Tax=unclassified Clostridium TaxID=2614128 RepID=UPI0002978647|nr:MULTISPECIES: aminotransferase class V-fold PLP-dependent enzyme [unclassified Clostridium]EKQ58113.1 MAG: OAH/OAS sulfhydrylase [Clostridium sp. Maddingley MBC34-26]
MGNYNFDTIKVREGYDPKDHNHSVAVPIYATASFEVGEVERFERLASLSEAGYLYSRLSNPTVSVLENRIAALDGGVAAVAVASGMAAITYALLAVAEGGGRILTTHQLYGGTVDALKKLYPRFGIQIDRIDNDGGIEEFRKGIKEDTKAIFIETISNPNAVLSDIEEIAKVAHENNIPLIVDNTFATPYLFNPIKHGADIVVYSATKALSGHGNVIAGVIVDSGKFNWENGKYPQFSEPYFTLKDLNGNERSYTDVFKESAFAGKVRLDYLTYFGAVLSPFDAYLILLGLETLSERVQKQVNNTKKIIEYLKTEDGVSWISYPTIETSPYKSLADKYFTKGAGSTFTFGFNGRPEQLNKLINSVKLFSYQANVGDARSLIINVAKTTHGELTEEQLKLAKIAPETIRLSIGLEDADDLINDLRQAFGEALK